MSIQLIVPSYTISIMHGDPGCLWRHVTLAAGVLMERLVIRHLYTSARLKRLLATFGISIALQQIAKNIFGTQARPLTSPVMAGWCLCAVNDVLAISNIRIAIFCLGVVVPWPDALRHDPHPLSVLKPGRLPRTRPWPPAWASTRTGSTC